MTTGFFVRSPPDHTVPLAEEPHLTVFENVESSGDVFQKDDKTAEESTTSELIPDALEKITEGVISKDGNLEDHSETKAPSMPEDSNSQHVCTKETMSDPPVLEAGIPEGDGGIVETMPVSSDSTVVLKEPEVLLDNSNPDVAAEIPQESPEDHNSKKRLTAVKDTDPVDESVEDERSLFSPTSPPFNPSGDSLSSISYEKPEDNEDDPDGIASLLGLKKSVKGEEVIQMQDLADSDDHCVVTIISRRSRYRAGNIRV